MRALLNSIDDMKSSLDAAVVFSIPALLGFLLAYLVARPTYFSSGGLFLRTTDLLALDGLSLVMALAASLASIFLISATIILVSLIVKERRTASRFSSRRVRAALKENILPVAFLGVALFSLNFLLQAVSLVVPALPLFHVILLLVYAAFFFAPYGMIIDNYDVALASTKSVSLLLKAPQRFLAWLAVVFSSLFVFHGLAFLILPYGVAEAASFTFVSLFLLPFSIIFAAHLYMDRYPLS